MNKNEECDIVKDLALPYTEGVINTTSKAFVEKHLLTCNNCKKYYNDINTNILNEKNNEKNKEQKNQQYELDFLKKIKQHMNILKITLMTIIIIIIVIIFWNLNKYNNITQVIDKAYNKIEYMKTLDNYTLTEKTLEKNYKNNSSDNIVSNYYYKNGKYKIQYGNTICYCEDDSYKKILVYNDLQQIDYYEQNFIEYKKGETFNLFSEIITYKTQLSGIYKLMLSIRTEKFNNIDCYIIRMGNHNSYRDIWINKNTFIVERTVENVDSQYYRERIYTLVENNVSDSDVDNSILDTEQYKNFTKNNVKNNVIEEMKKIYRY